MRDRKIRHSTIRSEVVIMDGGMNESVSSIELKGGELIAGYNYQIVEGSNGGYISVAGYERFDGRTRPSSISATESNHTAQDTARAAITQVPGIGSVLGVHIFKGDVYAFRNKIDLLSAGMFKATSSGWVEINTSANPLPTSGIYKFVNYNFSGSSTAFSMFWTDSVGKARMYDGTTFTTISNGGMGVNDKPINLIAHNDRLWLAYTGGSLQYSTVGVPTDWATSAGEFGVGDEITNLVTSVGNSLVVFCKDLIKIVNGYSASDFVIDSYSNSSGAFAKTANRLFGTIILMDDRGVTNLEATQEYGNFKSNTLSQKVQKTILSSKSLISCSTVSRDLNQYRLYFSNGNAIYFSFIGGKLRGATIIDFLNPVLTCSEGEDSAGNPVIYFTSNDGYVRQMDIGTSFDGEEIKTLLSTSFYHYKSPRNWKMFKELTFEISSVSDTDINIRLSYDYLSGYVPRYSSEKEVELLGAAARWGEGVWGTMRYSGSESTNRIRYPITGLGSNMSISLKTNKKYAKQHTVQNFTTDFILLRRQL